MNISTIQVSIYICKLEIMFINIVKRSAPEVARLQMEVEVVQQLQSNSFNIEKGDAKKDMAKLYWT